MSDYVYINSEPSLWTVGFYGPNGKWEPESDHSSIDDAADRVAELNGNPNKTNPNKKLRAALETIANKDYRGGLYTAIDIVNDMRQIARAALAKG